MKRLFSGIMLVLLYVGMLTLSFGIQSARSSPATIIVPDDYPTIQDAINAANDWDTIFVRNATYYENVVVNKSLTLIGENRYDTIVDGNSSGPAFLLEAQNASLINFTATNPRVLEPVQGAIVLRNTTNCLIESVEISNSDDGIDLVYSTHNQISDSGVFNSTFAGMFLGDSDENTISNNVVSGNIGVGIALGGSGCNNNLLINNQISSNNEGYYEEHPRYGGWGLDIVGNDNNVISNQIWNNVNGLILDTANNTIIRGNNISNNSGSGFNLIRGAENNTFSENTIQTKEGIEGASSFLISGNNLFYHNNFIGDSLPPVSSWAQNVWDAGYPSGGNYWSGYNVTDLFSGPYQNETGSDGIGDIPYVIDANNLDHYPLTKPYEGTHDIGIAALNPSKTIVGQSFCVNMDFKVINYGEGPENSEVTLLANSTVIGTRTVTLPMRNSTTIEFIWNTTGYAFGNYNATAYAEPVAGEIDTTDNNMTAWVTVTIPGDINGDFSVNFEDLVILTQAYGAKLGDTRWNPNADIQGNGVAGLTDLVTLAIHYGQRYP